MARPAGGTEGHDNLCGKREHKYEWERHAFLTLKTVQLFFNDCAGDVLHFSKKKKKKITALEK